MSNCRLALPVMLSGIRVAMVITIGVATIAAAIGAGGLGEFIFRGIAMVDNGVILAGAIPAALMALAADLSLSGVEKLLGAAPRLARYGSPNLPLRAGAHGSQRLRLARQRAEVGSKNFTEQLILGEILKQSLESACRMPVDGRFYLAGTYICQQAILAGRIDTYVEYTGTALAAILKQPARATRRPSTSRSSASINSASISTSCRRWDSTTALPWSCVETKRGRWA